VKPFTMQIPHLINLLHGDMTAWRQDLHAHPELGFEEHRTSEFVASKLAEFGWEVHRNIGKTGVVGLLRTGDGPSIGLRADMDALPIHEATTSPIDQSMKVACMRAATTATRPCCWAQRVTSLRHATSLAP
jgi:metal-dependent amidase/aminoacylase/carboxypeptidase family protein